MGIEVVVVLLILVILFVIGTVILTYLAQE